MPGLGGERAGGEVAVGPVEQEGEELGLPHRQGQRAVDAVKDARPLVDVDAGKIPMAPLPEGKPIAEPGQLAFGDPFVDIEAAPVGVIANLTVKPVEQLLVECQELTVDRYPATGIGGVLGIRVFSLQQPDLGPAG